MPSVAIGLRLCRAVRGQGVGYACVYLPSDVRPDIDEQSTHTGEWRGAVCEIANLIDMLHLPDCVREHAGAQSTEGGTQTHRDVPGSKPGSGCTQPRVRIWKDTQSVLGGGFPESRTTILKLPRCVCAVATRKSGCDAIRAEHEPWCAPAALLAAAMPWTSTANLSACVRRCMPLRVVFIREGLRDRASRGCRRAREMLEKWRFCTTFYRPSPHALVKRPLFGHLGHALGALARRDRAIL